MPTHPSTDFPTQSDSPSTDRFVRLLRVLTQTLGVGLLLIACIAGLEITFLLAQAGTALADLEGAIKNVTSNASKTLALANETFEMQRGYYRDSASHVKALTKAAAIDAIRLGRILDHADKSLDLLTDEAVRTLEAVQTLPIEVANQSHAIGFDSHELLQSATSAVASFEALARDEDITKSLGSIGRSSENIEQATAEASQAMGYIRDMLSPTKKSFWRRILELMIPRPTLSVP